MQRVTIKKRTIKNEDKEQAYYYVPALALKNSDNKVRLLVPHPISAIFPYSFPLYIAFAGRIAIYI